MGIRPEIWPFVVFVSLFWGALGLILARNASRRAKVWVVIGILEFVSLAYLLYFFRDPERTPPGRDDIAVAAADGVIAAITNVYEGQYLQTNCVRVSIFLSLFDVHVNRAPIAGQSTFLGYFPGRHLFTFQDKSSDVNQHNKILLEGRHTRCLITQIVGPVCRRVVYWPDHDQPVTLQQGDRFGMMKFGSRLDMYFPENTVNVTADLGDRVRAGETPVARILSAADSMPDR